jgi:hypothetical protein
VPANAPPNSTHAATSGQGCQRGNDEPAFGATPTIQAAGRAEIAVVGIDGSGFARADIAQGGPCRCTEVDLPIKCDRYHI